MVANMKYDLAPWEQDYYAVRDAAKARVKRHQNETGVTFSEDLFRRSWVYNPDFRGRERYLQSIGA